jgi:hypothetical protein
MTVDINDCVASLSHVEVPPAQSWKRRVGHRQRRLLLTAVLVFVVGGAGLIYQRSSGRAMHDYDSGPVRTESATTTSLVADIGRVVTFGGIILKNYSKSPAVLESIRIDPRLDSGITLVDLKAAGKGRGIGMVGTDRVFPPEGMPPEAVRPLPGAIVPPLQEDDRWGVEVLMAFKLNRPGQFGFKHAIIDYRIGGKRHRIRLSDGFVLCGPDKDYQNCDLDKFRELEN